ncbi:MAG TPA: glycosyltransferase family 2 protein [Pyrinomonadaceae bacterium]|jgi:GT2 family glycosyltransferase|nr:glycosyltransferase family 2 protein [Pyrinomonadaceae bacterium]
MQPDTTPALSVIIPVHNGGAHLPRCLEALRASDLTGREVIVVDDGSNDDSADATRARGFEVIRLDARRGPAAARNEGARRARGNILLFLDADVVARPDTLARVETFFREHEETAALFGSYDDAPDARGFISQYKNLAHHFIHQRSRADAETFWAGCGALRREAFTAVGGFDETEYTRPSIEDIELGRRLRRRGFRITLDRELQVKHLKRWTLGSLLRADVRDRALPWSRLILEEGSMPRDLNLRASDRASATLTCAALLTLAFAPVAFLFPALFSSLAAPTPLLPALLFCAASSMLAVVFVLNLPFLRFMRAHGGTLFSLASFAMLTLYYIYSACAFTFCHFERLWKSARVPEGGRRADARGRVEDA